jgi:hypothetical protein
MIDLKCQIQNRVFIGTDNGVDAAYYFDSIKVKIISYSPVSELNYFGECKIKNYSTKFDTINIDEVGCFILKKSGKVLKEIKSEKIGYKDKLCIFDSSNINHTFLIQKIKDYKLDKNCK